LSCRRRCSLCWLRSPWCSGGCSSTTNTLAVAVHHGTSIARVAGAVVPDKAGGAVGHTVALVTLGDGGITGAVGGFSRGFFGDKIDFGPIAQYVFPLEGGVAVGRRDTVDLVIEIEPNAGIVTFFHRVRLDRVDERDAIAIAIGGRTGTSERLGENVAAINAESLRVGTVVTAQAGYILLLVANSTFVGQALFGPRGRRGAGDRVLDRTAERVDFTAFHGPTTGRKEAICSQLVIKYQSTADENCLSSSS
jgi:hypothetical protein